METDADQLETLIRSRGSLQPLWDSVLTLEDGSTTFGPFLTLEERA